jgi:hypothetical protein
VSYAAESHAAWAAVVAATLARSEAAEQREADALVREAARILNRPRPPPLASANRIAT